MTVLSFGDGSGRRNGGACPRATNGDVLPSRTRLRGRGRADTGRYLDCGDSDRSGVAACRPHAKFFSASLRVSLERQERFATT